ncbi:Cof-type HAD-IIB family hydrolase [Paenibacillus sepulcri]|uniref:Cof-type HAD-IIB family hydrolase n=2 Tax=Paenibacillus sepulcri TaxID=359917 RepID=A0ABS7C9J1_9BACL|nr:Cof-type HAD-IIB family hydrolase [Paenibacillus sepulcri]
MSATLYVSDLDGTLLNEHQQISDETRDILNQLISQGMWITFATARSQDSAARLLQGIHFHLPMIFFNGVFIYDPAGGRLIQSNLLGAETAAQIIASCESDGLHPLVYTMDSAGSSHVYYKGIFNPSEDRYISDRLSAGDSRFRLVDHYRDALKESIVNVITVGAQEQLDPAYMAFHQHPELICHYGPDIYAPGYHWLEIANSRANKREAVEFVKRRLKAERLVCFGDNLNDLPMFEAADEKYAVANAHELVKAAATGMILSNMEHGVAVYLNSLQHMIRP